MRDCINCIHSILDEWCSCGDEGYTIECKLGMDTYSDDDCKEFQS